MDINQLNETPAWEWPEGADGFLLGVLQGGALDAPDRLLAVELAGDYTVMNNELAQALLAVATNHDETVDVRSQAAVSLGPALEDADTLGFEDPDDLLISQEMFARLKSGLKALYEDRAMPKQLRRRVLEAAVRAPQEWHRPAVREALAQNDEAWTLTAVFCMRFVSGFEAEILQALKSQDSDIQYQAVCAAGNWELTDAWPHIEAILQAKDADRYLLLAAIESVPNLRPDAAAEILTDYADHDDEAIADAAMEAMSMAGIMVELEDEDEEDDDDAY